MATRVPPLLSWEDRGHETFTTSFPAGNRLDPMRTILKRAVEKTLARSGLRRLKWTVHRESAAILAYHNVVPDEDPALGDTSLHLPVRDFRAQLDLLNRYFEVIPLEHLFGPTSSPSRPRAAITFDDAYRGAIRLGIPELRSRGFPATIFVSPGLLGTPGFWWDRLSTERDRGLPGGVRRFALEELGGHQERILGWATANRLDMVDMPDLYRGVEESEILGLAGERGVSFGSHTWTHVNLASVTSEQAMEELTQPLAWLNRLGGNPDVVSYPYGSWDPRVGEQARDAQYRFGLLVEGGLATPSSISEHPYSVPRINIPRGLSADGFLLRASGLWPR